MTKLFEEAIDKARALPEARQDDLARALLEMMSEPQLSRRLNGEQVEEVRRRQNDLRSSAQSPATDEEVAALWRRCGL